MCRKSAKTAARPLADSRDSWIWQLLGKPFTLSAADDEAMLRTKQLTASGASWRPSSCCHDSRRLQGPGGL